MAKYELHDQFLDMHGRIALGDRALIAIAAQVEVRSVLRASAELLSHGLDDVLIGSYARRVSIWPGKDVDVFARLMSETIHTLDPDVAYDMFGRALERFAREGRLTPQPRSYKIDYYPDRAPGADFIRAAAQQYEWARSRVDRVVRDVRQVAFEFSVDVVPAVKWDGHYGIPQTARIGPAGERQRTGEWHRTNPVELTEETKVRNRSPRIAGVGGYVRTVKTVRQVKSHHLNGTKPSSLFYEFVLHEGFKSGAITGLSWADLTASALRFIATRLTTVSVDPVRDPILGVPYTPQPSATDLATAQAVFQEQARRAQRAVAADSRCQAAIEWRSILGGNGRDTDVFWLPPGCRGDGLAIGGAAAANIASGGTRERSFGER